MNSITNISRQNGMLPDRYWYQLNEQSPEENYAEQKDALVQVQFDDDSVVIKSEIEVK